MGDDEGRGLTGFSCWTRQPSRSSEREEIVTKKRNAECRGQKKKKVQREKAFAFVEGGVRIQGVRGGRIGTDGQSEGKKTAPGGRTRRLCIRPIIS